MAAKESAKEFEGLVVMITGAASGIGFATARAFARQGALLSLADLNGDALKISADGCQVESPQGSQPSCTVGDLTDAQIRVAFKDNTLKTYGRINILINCAGRALQDTITDYDLDVFQKIMDTNVKLAYHLTGLCVPHLVETKGNIVNVSSVASMNSRHAGLLSYSISKAAMDIFTKHISGELGPQGVRVNSVNPAFTYTNIMGPMSKEEFHAKHGMKSVFKRCGESNEIADAILFLASRKSSFTTGTNFMIDGGISTHRIPYELF